MVLYAIFTCECVVCVNLCQCQMERSHGHNRLLNPSDALFDRALLLATNWAGGHLFWCFLSPSSAPSVSAFRKKTMASTSSASQVSAWTWSWDNLPRSSFLVHQIKGYVCLSLVSFTFSHLLHTFIIQICMLSRKTEERKDGWCCRPCSPCLAPWATKRWRVVFEGLYLYHKPPEDGGSHCSPMAAGKKKLWILCDCIAFKTFWIQHTNCASHNK